MKKIIVGQILYQEVKCDIVEREVCRVGSKYLYVKGLNYMPFGVKSLEYIDEHYCGRNITLYLSKQDILDEREIIVLKARVCSRFGLGIIPVLTKEQWTAIDAILNPKNTTDI